VVHSCFDIIIIIIIIIVQCRMKVGAIDAAALG